MDGNTRGFSSAVVVSGVPAAVAVGLKSGGGVLGCSSSGGRSQQAGRPPAGRSGSRAHPRAESGCCLALVED